MIKKQVEDDSGVDLEIGKIIGKRWEVVEKLGEGGCGSVYKVQDVSTKAKAAMKAESNKIPGGSVLKLEVQILTRMHGRKHVTQIYQSAKRKTFSYMIITLLGPSLNYLLRQCSEKTLSTQTRVGINVLYGLKQLHEIGFIHRDIKPANLAIGRKGFETRIIHLLDFGLAREYITQEKGKIKIRAPRRAALFRGTIRYCSPNSHLRKEQGRHDDIWSMMYVLAEMRDPLPWEKYRTRDAIGMVKLRAKDVDLLKNSPKQYLDIIAHLRTLNYFSRPDYSMIFKKFREIMVELNIQYTDPFDWEGENKYRSLTKITQSLYEMKPVSDSSTASKSSKFDESEFSSHALQDSIYDNTKIFTETDFEKNEIGF